MWGNAGGGVEKCVGVRKSVERGVGKCVGEVWKSVLGCGEV